MKRWFHLPLILLSLGGTMAVAPIAQGDEPKFKKIRVTEKFYCEGAHAADFDHDGHVDIVSGPFWYAGPEYKDRYSIYEGDPFDINGYSKNFSAFTDDFNNDGWADVFVVGFPGAESWWYENPKSKDGKWTQHVAVTVTDNESPIIADITGDGKTELIFHTDGYYGYATPNPNHPEQPWTFHRISEKIAGGRFQHGLGIGDVDGDGRMDMMFMNGWLQQPASLEGDPMWKLHAFPFADKQGGAHMYAYDFDGDGDNDVLTSIEAHGYGLSWYENVKENGEITFKQHVILGRTKEENAYGVCFTQMHSIDLVDIDQDGLLDIVTGKRFWAHNGNDPEEREPAVLYWFKTVRKDGKVDFVPNLIDNDSGVGTQVEAIDVSGDGKLDIVVGNKKGTFVHIQQ